MQPFLAFAIAYLLGSIPFGFLLVKWKTGRDVRSSGSGNIGATNVFRTSGPGIGVATLALDTLKGWLAVYLAAHLTGFSDFWTSIAAIAVLLGHIFPVFLRFKGGKAVASFVGAFLYLAPVPLCAVLLVFGVTVWRTHFISLGSILGAFTFPVAVWIILHPSWPLLAASVLAGILILSRHRDNIQRLNAGTESRFTLRRSSV